MSARMVKKVKRLQAISRYKNKAWKRFQWKNHKALLVIPWDYYQFFYKRDYFLILWISRKKLIPFCTTLFNIRIITKFWWYFKKITVISKHDMSIIADISSHTDTAIGSLQTLKTTSPDICFTNISLQTEQFFNKKTNELDMTIASEAITQRWRGHQLPLARNNIISLKLYHQLPILSVDSFVYDTKPRVFIFFLSKWLKNKDSKLRVTPSAPLRPAVSFPTNPRHPLP